MNWRGLQILFLPLIRPPLRFAQTAHVSLLPSTNGMPFPAALRMSPISSSGILVSFRMLLPIIPSPPLYTTSMEPAAF
jgi:hypothetical protein